jgi:hypothetical protein
MHDPGNAPLELDPRVETGVPKRSCFAKYLLPGPFPGRYYRPALTTYPCHQGGRPPIVA